MSVIEKLENELNEIIQMYPNLRSNIEYIRSLINSIETNLPVIVEPPDYHNAKNDPPLCLNRQRDYYEWIKECEEYEKNNPSNK